MPKLSEFLFGKKEKTKQLPTMMPNQLDFMKSILSGATPGMSSGLEYLQQLLSDDDEAFSAFEAPYKTQFEEQIIPALAERFAGLNAQSSSAFGQALGQAGAGLLENLAALREGLKMQALGQLGGLSSLGMGQAFENIYQPGTSGLFGGLMPGLGSGLGSGLGTGISQLFKKK